MKDKAVHMEKWIVAVLALLLVGGACLCITRHYTHYSFGQQSSANDKAQHSVVY